MADTIYNTAGRVVGQRGARAGEKFKSQAELDAEAAEAEYAKEQGATGIAGAGKRSKPEYKAGFETWMAARKKRKSGATGAEAIDALAASK